MIKIESNVPVPEREAAYPFKHMEIGDSFFIPTDNPARIARNVTTAASTYRRKHAENFHITVRQLDDGVRVWRVAKSARRYPS